MSSSTGPAEILLLCSKPSAESMRLISACKGELKRCLSKVGAGTAWTSSSSDSSSEFSEAELFLDDLGLHLTALLCGSPDILQKEASSLVQGVPQLRVQQVDVGLNDL